MLRLTPPGQKEVLDGWTAQVRCITVPTTSSPCRLAPGRDGSTSVSAESLGCGASVNQDGPRGRHHRLSRRWPRHRGGRIRSISTATRSAAMASRARIRSTWCSGEPSSRCRDQRWFADRLRQWRLAGERRQFRTGLTITNNSGRGSSCSTGPPARDRRQHVVDQQPVRITTVDSGGNILEAMSRSRTASRAS